jgi:hypothetical protein
MRVYKHLVGSLDLLIQIVSAYFPIFLINLLIYFDLADAPIAGPPFLEGEFPGGLDQGLQTSSRQFGSSYPDGECIFSYLFDYFIDIL